jgi:hypothetical protein
MISGFRANLRANIRERLPSAAAAIAVQAGLLALLVFSFEVVRHIAVEKETTLILPRLTRPAPPHAQASPDGRSRPPASAIAPPAGALPAYARPDFQFAAPQRATAASRDLNRDIVRCRVENAASLNPLDRKDCPQPDMARHDPATLPLDPGKPVRNAEVWKDDAARKNTPFTLPGGDALHTALMLLLHPSIFGDKRAYSAPGPELPPMDGAEMARQHALLSDHCLALDDTTRRNCERDSAAEYRATIATFGAPAPDHPHVADTAFNQALAAVQARNRSLSAKPVLASGPNKGGGDEKSGSTGGAGGGVPAVGGAGR